MPAYSGWSNSLAGVRQRLQRFPILTRLLIGNSCVIVVGAVGGTLVTHYVAQLRIEADYWLIGPFAAVGILLSLLVNYWIVKTTLTPLHELREAVDRIQAGQGRPKVSLPNASDPDLSRLVIAVNSMLARLDERTFQLHAISEHTINAQEDERKRIARGLHDDTSQALSTLIITLERLEGALPAEARDVQHQLQAARLLATRTLEDLRKVIYDLRPTMLDDLGLVPAIRWYTRSSLEGAGIQVKIDAPDEAIRLPPPLETTLFRVVQEAINNIVRHANAQAVSICLRREDSCVRLRIEDNGRGFDVDRISGQALRLRRLGLLGIRERMDLVGGEVIVESVPGQGTRLQVSVPVLEKMETCDGQNQSAAR